MMKQNDYRESCQFLLDLARSYQGKCEETFKAYEKNVTKRLFATPASFLFLPRGYYSPSLFQELLDDNVKRGRLLKNRPDRPDYYEYGFDEKGKLITVTIRFNDKMIRREFICYRENQQIGIRFDLFLRKERIEMVTVAEFTGPRLKAVQRASLSSDFSKVTDYEEERYRYFQDHIDAVWTQFVPYDPDSTLRSDDVKIQKILETLARDERMHKDLCNIARLNVPIRDGKTTGSYTVLERSASEKENGALRPHRLDQELDIEKLSRISMGEFL